LLKGKNLAKKKYWICQEIKVYLGSKKVLLKDKSLKLGSKQALSITNV
jgi:hypothetical protein